MNGSKLPRVLRTASIEITTCGRNPNMMMLEIVTHQIIGELVGEVGQIL